MKAARLVVLGVAVAAGGIAAYLAAGSKPPPPPPAPAAPPLATVEVLVAKSDLNRGQVLADQDIGWQTWPAAAANANFIKKSEQPNAVKDFSGAIVRVSMVAGDTNSRAQCGNGEGLGIHGGGAAERHACGRGRYFAGVRHRRVHPSG